MVQHALQAGRIETVLIMQDRRKKAAFWTMALLAIVFIALLIAGFSYAGHFFVVERVPHQAEVCVVLAGKFSRAMYAADLYHKGLIPNILITTHEREVALEQL